MGVNLGTSCHPRAGPEGPRRTNHMGPRIKTEDGRLDGYLFTTGCWSKHSVESGITTQPCLERVHPAVFGLGKSGTAKHPPWTPITDG